MNSIISANQKSITETESLKMGSMIPFYSASKALPELGTQYQKVSPYISFGAGVAPQDKSITWKFPPGAGFMYEGSVGLTCVASEIVAGDLAGDISLNMLGQMDWLCNGQPVLTMTGAALRALVKTLPTEQQLFIYRYSKPLNTSTELLATPAAPATFVTYVPLIASWLSETQKCLLLNQIGDLQLRFQFAPLLQFGLTGAATITSVSNSTLYVQTYMPKLSVYNQMVLNDWSKSLVIEAFNTYTEVVPIVSTTTVANYTLTCPFLAYRIHFFVQNIANVVASPMRPIDSISMNIGGVPFIDSYAKSRVMSMKARNGIASLETTNATTISFDNELITTVDFGLESTRNKNTGTAFLQELRGATITVNFPALTAADNVLYIVTEYWQNLEYVPSGSGSNGILRVMNNN